MSVATFAILLAGTLCLGTTSYVAVRYGVAAIRARTWEERFVPLHAALFAVAIVLRVILGLLVTFRPVPRALHASLMIPADVIVTATLVAMLYSASKRERVARLAREGKIDRRTRG